tara:strand:- start:137 stop:340 length:204 start_codon:yes stop_codon:yes gene_type:complete
MIAHDRAVQPAAQPRCSYALLLPVLDSLAPPAHPLVKNKFKTLKKNRPELSPCVMMLDNLHTPVNRL